MANEQRKEICKAFYVDSEETGKAVAWGEHTRYTSEIMKVGE